MILFSWLSTVVKSFKVILQSKDLNKNYRNRKVFNDPVHGHIELHPLCVKIIDTPQFQRLRFIKQLGLFYYVYPGAAHNRFEHSLGVCHLAGRLVKALKKRQPELTIDSKDVLCVEIAGLCHDLGHGPFSHLFDEKFIPQKLPGIQWKHHEASRKMFLYLLEENNLRPEFEKYGLSQKDITFIEEQIAGTKDNSIKEWNYKGRPKSKSFLYEIVANNRNGIDVDKWDYFARDCLLLGIRNNFDHNRFIHFARVIDVDGHKQICARDKENGALFDMFHTREMLHKNAYKHKTHHILETMVTEALIMADDHIKFTGTYGPVKMSEAIHDMKAFSQITDDVFYQILHSEQPELAASHEILGNILKRKLYKSVGQIQISVDKFLTEDKLQASKMEIIQKIPSSDMEKASLKESDIIIQLVNFDLGMKEKSPIENVRFYSKEDPDFAKPLSEHERSSLLPKAFVEQQLRVQCKRSEKAATDLVFKAFSSWCQEKGHPLPSGVMKTAQSVAKQNGSHLVTTPANGAHNFKK